MLKKFFVLLIIIPVILFLSSCRLDFELYDSYDFTEDNKWDIFTENPWVQSKDDTIVKAGDYSLKLTMDTDQRYGYGRASVKKAYDLHTRSDIEIEVVFSVKDVNNLIVERVTWDQLKLMVNIGDEKFNKDKLKIIEEKERWKTYSYQTTATITSYYDPTLWVRIVFEADRLQNPEDVLIYLDDIHVRVDEIHFKQ